MSLSNIRAASLVAGALLLGASHATKIVILTATTTICPIPTTTTLGCDVSTSPTKSGSLSVSTQGPLTLSSTSLLSSSNASVLPSTTQVTSPTAVVSTPSQTTLITRTEASSTTAVPPSSSSCSEVTASSATSSSSNASSISSTTQVTSPAVGVSTPLQTTLITRTGTSSTTAMALSSSSCSEVTASSATSSSSNASDIASTTQVTSPAAVVSTPSQTTLITRTKASSTTAVPLSSSSSSEDATASSVASFSSRPSSAASSSSAAATPTAIVRAYPADIVDQLRDSSISKLETYLRRNPSSSGCTLENASIRREWSDLSVAEREEYTAAVKCLQAASPKSPQQLVPGARSRFDDFLATHINQTDSIHNTANFLSWHRYYVWTYEKALREECGYRGFQPYWNWDRYAADPANSPLFNGNASSMSGNSVNGGCVTSGPFANMQVNLGPGFSLSYNPRCLKRDISKSQAALTTADKTYALITGSADIASFQNTMQGVTGVHAGGHFTIGGDPGSDIHASAGDPAFYHHHAMIDRVWWIWQMQDLSRRLTEVAGSVAGSWRQGTGKDLVDLGINAGAVTIDDLLDTMGGLDGQMCYIYV